MEEESPSIQLAIKLCWSVLGADASAIKAANISTEPNSPDVQSRSLLVMAPAFWKVGTQACDPVQALSHSLHRAKKVSETLEKDRIFSNSSRCSYTSAELLSCISP